MFDDQPIANSSGGQPPNNLPFAEPEDIFAGTEASGGSSVPESPLSSPAMTPSAPSAMGSGRLQPVSPPSTADAVSAPLPPMPSEEPDLRLSDESPVKPTMPLVQPSFTADSSVLPNEPRDASSMAAMPAPAVSSAQPVPPSSSAGVQPPPASPTGGPVMDYDVKGPRLGKLLFRMMLVLLILFGLLVIGWVVYTVFLQATKSDTVSNTTDIPTFDVDAPPQHTPDVSNTLPANTVDTVDETILFGQPVDTDADGLDDVRERDIQTDPDNWDTDGDGLSDGDEVIIWKSNPLYPDTDGDGFLDGQEVKSGYNPTGPGKIFEPPQDVSSQPTADALVSPPLPDISATSVPDPVVQGTVGVQQ